MKRLPWLLLLFLGPQAFAGFAASRANSGLPPFIGYKDAPTAAQSVGTSSSTQIVAVYVPVPLTLTGVRFNVGAQSGNCQAGLYDATGVKLAASAVTTCPAIGAQTLSFVTPATVLSGIYYLALGADNTTQTFGKSSGNNVIGCAFITANLPMANITLPGTTTSNCFAMVGLVSGGLTQ